MVDYADDPQPSQDSWVDEAMARLSTRQKSELLYGAGPWNVRPPEPLQLDDLVVTDGPNGARGVTFHTEPSACFPCETALAATWDPDLMAKVTAAIGAEARSKAASVLLAPAAPCSCTAIRGARCTGSEETVSSFFGACFRPTRLTDAASPELRAACPRNTQRAICPDQPRSPGYPRRFAVTRPAGRRRHHQRPGRGDSAHPVHFPQPRQGRDLSNHSILEDRECTDLVQDQQPGA